MDFARSDDPAVQTQLERLAALSPGRDVLGLERITALLARIGNPERRLPPVFHVAGTNGKGSTCAFLRGCIEAAGLSAHVYTSPHLVRFNERIRLAGRLIDDAALAALLSEVLDAADGIFASFFEITTAAAFLAFARTPADACIVEVGLGGRLDATNVIPFPVACGIAALGIDHQSFLGETLAEIAGEKAGIARAALPLVTFAYDGAAEESVQAAANDIGALRLKQGETWSVEDGRYSDRYGSIAFPPLALPGDHQQANAGLALAMLRHQRAVTVPEDAMILGLAEARWPARLQKMSAGPLVGDRDVWLDGGHNESAATAIAAAFACEDKLDLVIGMLANKDARGFLRSLAPIAKSVTALPVPGHEHHMPSDLRAIAAGLNITAYEATDLTTAVTPLTGPILITGSLYLAGVALALNDELPR